MKKVFIIGLLSILLIIGCSTNNTNSTPALTLEQAQTTAESFINDYLVSAGSEVTIQEIVEEGGVYKLTVLLSDGQEVDSYISKDGTIFFPEAFNIEKVKQQANQTNTNTTNISQEIPKSAKPQVELFVMSHCPYGTQIEKGILPVLALIADQIDFQLKFCDYAMHDKTELDEELRQYCIQKEQSDKLLSYLECFLTDGDSDRCLAEVQIDTSELASCVSQTDEQYQVTEKYNSKTGWQGNYPPFDVYAADNAKYSVTGSPTLVINGITASVGRDPQSLMKAICSTFNTVPDACSQTLSSAVPSAGFGTGTTNSNASTGCAQ